jgi:hypothetical protein
MSSASPMAAEPFITAFSRIRSRVADMCSMYTDPYPAFPKNLDPYLSWIQIADPDVQIATFSK